MRLTLTSVLTALLLPTLLFAASCSSGKKAPAPEDLPTVGKVLSANDGTGSVVISLGSKDGVRPGETLPVVRGGAVITEIIIHAAQQSQASGTVIGGSSSGTVRPGDDVIIR